MIIITHEQWPIIHPETERPDGRWSITLEHCGHASKSFVFRFCDDFESSHLYYVQAVDAAQNHANDHFNNL